MVGKRERLREEPAWEPRWEDHEAAARNIIRKSVWRVAPLYSRQDLLSEAWIVFDRCVRRYPAVVDPPHFMVLFRRALTNTIHNMATRRTRSIYQDGGTIRSLQAIVADGSRSETADFLEARPENHEDERFRLRVRDLEPMLLPLLDAADDIRHPKKGRTVRDRTRLNPDGSRMTTNEYLCRLAGYDPASTDLRTRLDRFLAL
jgi:hypothetical protein